MILFIVDSDKDERNTLHLSSEPRCKVKDNWIYRQYLKTMILHRRRGDIHHIDSTTSQLVCWGHVYPDVISFLHRDISMPLKQRLKKSVSLITGFWKPHQATTPKGVLGQAKHPRSFSTDRFRGASSGRFFTLIWHTHHTPLTLSRSEDISGEDDVASLDIANKHNHHRWQATDKD